jgi:Mn2+/Fe2+ NRAMP family transporter
MPSPVASITASSSSSSATAQAVVLIVVVLVLALVLVMVLVLVLVLVAVVLALLVMLTMREREILRAVRRRSRTFVVRVCAVTARAGSVREEHARKLVRLGELCSAEERVRNSWETIVGASCAHETFEG